MDKIKLFCLPYAGGSAVIYLKLKRYLNNNIELVPIELAGRGKRYNELLYEDMDEAVNDIFNVVKNEIHNYKYAVLGYSMGTIISYELIKKIIEEKLDGPEHVFFAAKEPMYMETKEKSIHKLIDNEFINEIVKLGGIPKEILEQKGILDFFLPILRADYRIVELYKDTSEITDLGCDITALGGKKDNITEEKMYAWREYTTKRFKLHMFEGGHFFINDNIENICNIINEELQYVTSL